MPAFGTTLLQTLLEAHLPDCTRLPECHTVCDLVTSYAKRIGQWNKSSAFFGSKDSMRSFYRGVLWSMVENICQLPGGCHNVVLKDPNFAKALPALIELMPESHVILLIRDPRDIAASFVQIGQREHLRHKRSMYSTRNINWICKRIQSAYRTYLTHRRELARVQSVRYEKLCKRPKKTMRSIFERAGAPYNRIGYDQSLTWCRPEHRHSNEAWISELEGCAPTSAHVNYYAEVLTKSEVRRVQKQCATILTEFGYKKSKRVK